MNDLGRGIRLALVMIGLVIAPFYIHQETGIVTAVWIVVTFLMCCFNASTIKNSLEATDKTLETIMEQYTKLNDAIEHYDRATEAMNKAIAKKGKK